MLRAHRQTPKAQACQLFANSSLMHGDAEALFDLAFQINAPPAHNPIGLEIIYENPIDMRIPILYKNPNGGFSHGTQRTWQA